MRPAPDSGWLPILRLVLGFSIVLILATLAGLIALGKVEEKTSYGLREIVTTLSLLAGGILFTGKDEKK